MHYFANLAFGIRKHTTQSFLLPPSGAGETAPSKTAPTGTAATQLLRLLARTARPSSWGAAASRFQGLTNASAHATFRKMEDTLFPPRDKAARRLWDTMNKFKKGGGRKLGRELLLPAESGYLRACAHQFAERLGLQHISMGEGQARRVLLQLPERPRGAGKSASASAADGATDPDEPAAKRKRASEQASASAADGEGLEEEAEEDGAAGAAVPKKAQPPPRKPFMTRLTACMKQDDPHEALRVFEDMCAQGLPPDGHMCSMLLHLFSNASPPMRPESERVFAATQRAGVVPDEPSWSGMVRLFSLHGDLAQARWPRSTRRAAHAHAPPCTHAHAHAHAHAHTRARTWGARAPPFLIVQWR